MSIMWWITAQLAARFSEPLSQPRFNPRPPGVIRPGSATQAVLAFLRENPTRYFTCFDLCRNTQRSPKSVNHACLYLRAQSLICAYPDSARNPRYMKYRAADPAAIKAKDQSGDFKPTKQNARVLCGRFYQP